MIARWSITQASKVAALGHHAHLVTLAPDWIQLATDSGAAVMVLDSSGRIVFINGTAARVFAKHSAKDAIGSNLGAFLPEAAATERMEVSRSVISSGESVAFRDLWSGIAFRATVRRIELGATAGQGAMWVFARETALLHETGENPGLRVIDAKHTDLGPLSGLTASELRVLALIGEGLTNAEIADKLHRAVKTIESHRAALSEKTGSASRVQLGIMARRAGLANRISLADKRHTSVPA